MLSYTIFLIATIITATSASNSTDASLYSQAEFIPWNWSVKSSNTDTVCPAPSSILGTFGATNVVVSLTNLVFGNRILVHKISLGVLGKPRGNKWWIWFIIPLGIQLGANALVAYLYKHTPGYEEGFTITDLVFFYTTRPRLGWLVLTLTMPFGRKKKNIHTSRATSATSSATEDAIQLLDTVSVSGHAEASTEYEATASKTKRSRPGQKSAKSDVEYVEDGWYEASAKGSLLAEIFLLIIASYYNGKTVHFATTRGYYLIGHLKGPHAHDARVMYIGALLFLVFLYFAIFYLVFILATSDTEVTRQFCITIIITTWLFSWLFWGGYVHLARDL